MKRLLLPGALRSLPSAAEQAAGCLGTRHRTALVHCSSVDGRGASWQREQREQAFARFAVGRNEMRKVNAGRSGSCGPCQSASEMSQGGCARKRVGAGECGGAVHRLSLIHI